MISGKCKACGHRFQVDPKHKLSTFIQKNPPPHEENGRTVETAVEARAGFLDRPVFVVLIASVAAVVVGFVLTYLGVVKL